MKLLFTFPSSRHIAVAVFVAGSMSFGSAGAQQADNKTSTADIQRGRYLVRITGCNDCHTPGYPESGGKTDEKLWLTGSPLGWRGPWGTSYASNLRLVLQNLSEAQWLKHARNEWRPPMPWFNLREMSDADLRAMYRYIRHLGPAGEPAPAYVPPDRTPKQPYVQFPPPPK
jgi:mono/diheme cytochrome c family protein